MKNRVSTRLRPHILAFAMLVSACQTTTERTPEMRQQLVNSMITASTAMCVVKVNEDTELSDTLKTLNRAADDFCTCVYRSMFDNMDDKLVDGFFDDMGNFGTDAITRQPWKDRAIESTLFCLSPPNAA